MIKRVELATIDSCLNKAGSEEMIFVLRAKDPAASETIAEWIRIRLRMKLNKEGDEKLRQAFNCAAEMDRQRKELNPEAAYRIGNLKEGTCECGHSGAVHGSDGKICAACSCKVFCEAHDPARAVPSAIEDR